MIFKNHDTVSPEIKTQIQRVIGVWKTHLGDSLAGIYLHGTIVLNCFVESNGGRFGSNIDILILTESRLCRNTRISIAREIVNIDRTPAPLEMLKYSLINSFQQRIFYYHK